MPRIRTIKPQFWVDEDLGVLPRDARLLYIGLWNLCDDYGVFEWRPARIKAQLFPYDKEIEGTDIAEWLAALQGKGNVIPFTEKGESFGYVPSFLKHQEIKKPSKWRFATPPVTHQYPTATPPVTQGLPSSSLKEKEKEKVKGKGAAAPPTPSPDPRLAAAAAAYENTIGVITETVGNLLKDMTEVEYKDAPVEWFTEAFQEAAKANVRKLSYVKSCLRNWTDNGRNNGQRHEQSGRHPQRGLPGNEPAGAFADIS